jgi:hypothetical protein
MAMRHRERRAQQDGVLFEVGIVFSLCHAELQTLVYTFNTPLFPFLCIVLVIFQPLRSQA